MARTRHDRAKDETLARHTERLREADTVLASANDRLRVARDLRDAAIQDAVRAGLSLRQIGSVLGLSPQGVSAAAAPEKPAYDTIGKTYSSTRQPDPRIRDAIWSALGDARTVVNVGAGAGSYEPPSTLLAVEPSMVMVAQRPAGLAPAALTTADRIPLPDNSVDAALAVLTIHWWRDLEASLAEIRRVARRLVIFTWDPEVTSAFWLLGYLPAIREGDRGVEVPIPHLCELLGTADVQPVLVPHDCVDGFLGAFWRRPERYFDPTVRAGISAFSRVEPPLINAGLEVLQEDLRSGAWAERNADLLDLDAFDLGYRLVVADFR